MPKTSTITKEHHLELEQSLSLYADQLARHGGTQDEKYVYTAMRDTLVQEHMLIHALKGQLFVGAHSLGGIGIPEEVRLLFTFVHLPPRITIIPTRFLVRLNIITGQVIPPIIDPYYGPIHPMGNAGQQVALGQIRAFVDVQSDFRIHDVSFSGTSLRGKIRAYLHLRQPGPFGSTLFDFTVIDIDEPFSVDLIFDRPIPLYTIGPATFQVTLHNNPRRICGEVQIGVDLPVIGHWGQNFTLACVNF